MITTMRGRGRRVLLLALAAAALTACSSATTTAESAAPAPATTTPADTGPGTGTVSLGERFNIIGRNHEALASAAITAIEVDPDCSADRRYGGDGQPDNGHYIAVEMDIATTAEFDQSEFNYPSGMDFTMTGPDGYTRGQLDTQASCLYDRDRFGTPFVASSKYRGWVLLDAPATTGSLTFRSHHGMPANVDAAITVAIPASGKASASAEPSVTEDAADFAQIRENIQRNGGEPSNSAESQYLYACEQTTLPADQCP